jgi:acyl-CoA synthetase (AMP-forming)/AMP-acid ligase II
VMWQQEDVFFAGLQGGNPGGAPLESPGQLAALALENTEPITMLPAAPFIHGAAQWAALIGLFGGGKVVLVPGKSFNAKLACKLIAAEKVNTMTFVGDAMARPLVEALRAANGDVDMSSLMVIASAGAILSDSVKEDLAAVLGEDMKPLEPGCGTIGRLARSGRLPIGYYKDPEKTAATFLEIDGRRWVVPGDLATIEADGKITVFGRGAVCINSGGEKIFPEEVEAALKAHPSVMDAVVVGVPDERWGQRVAAIIQARPGMVVTLNLLDAHCRTKIAGYKVPRQLRVVDEIQRHPSGKPDYRWASATAREGAPS